MFFGKSKNTENALTFDAVKADMANGGQLIDVRTPGEFADGHIEGAINIPVQNIMQSALVKAAKDQSIYVYCLSGGRSGQAAMVLKNAGFTHVTNLGSIGRVQKMGGNIV